MRLNKYLSEKGLCSRREADDWIGSGRVEINRRIALLGTPVEDGDEVRVDGRVVSERKAAHVTIVFNKPVGVTCTTEARVRDNIIDFIGHEQRIFPIGRLDKDSEGLILLTSDGDIVNTLLRAEHGHEKEYLVEVDRPVSDGFLASMQRGVNILDTRTLPCKAWRTGPHSFRIVLTQGLNRQIRRMCEHFGYEVIALQRTRFVNIELGNLQLGYWRDLSAAEMRQLLA
ncbi:MAG: pseudouridine synthase [Stagnimonas sp.]|nr:pseudouridine synthase [Stagnimonas sp.]